VSGCGNGPQTVQPLFGRFRVTSACKVDTTTWHAGPHGYIVLVPSRRAIGSVERFPQLGVTTCVTTRRHPQTALRTAIELLP
jgi:hypothetical protein